jgi:hypothetical protein
MDTKTVVATCFNCRGSKKKERVTHFAKWEVFCPDCSHALVWERLDPTKPFPPINSLWWTEVNDA